MRPLRVVAADTSLGGAPEPERSRVLVRVRAGGGVDDGSRPVHDLELVVLPFRARGPLVRAVADLHRIATERLGGIVRVEDELDHLPVAFVRVVEVVEGVEEPVLERDLARALGFRHDVGVHDRLASRRESFRPVRVVAARVERVAREVEVVLEAIDEILGRGRDLHEVGSVPRAAQRDRRLVEDEVDVRRDERLAVTALLGLLDDAHDRRVTLGERLLVGVVGGSSRRGDERGERDRSDEQVSADVAHPAHSPPTRGRSTLEPATGSRVRVA